MVSRKQYTLNVRRALCLAAIEAEVLPHAYSTGYDPLRRKLIQARVRIIARRQDSAGRDDSERLRLSSDCDRSAARLASF